MELQKTITSEENEEELLLPGFRFHPTDEELVGFYLRRKVEMKPLCIELIKQINIYKYDPWDLPKVNSSAGDKEWYFFCIRGRKYRNSIRPNRVTGSGFWKATGIDRPIHSSVAAQPNSDSIIGLKKSLVYYRGCAGKGTKTDWMMHEFRLPPGEKNTNIHDKKNTTQEAEIWTICRIFKRNVTYSKYAQDWRSTSNKENPTVFSSKSRAFESENGNKYTTGCFGVSGDEQMESKPIIEQCEEKNQYFSSPLSSVTQAPLPTFYSTLHSGNSGEFLKDCSWDEIGSILNFPTDPTLISGCRYY